jgi:hypothetical protein
MWNGDLQHGEDRLLNEPVPGRLCRPPGITCARSRSFVTDKRVRDLTGSVYGRRMYEAMRYWVNRPEWGTEQHEFAAAWRASRVGRVALVEVSRPQRHTCRG